MMFIWKDYNIEYNTIINSWLDDDAKRFTSIDVDWQDYFQYWECNSDSNKGEYFWSKIIADENDIPIGVIAIGLFEDIFTISEYIVDPKKRNIGYGSSALKELLLEAERIIGKNITFANAVIYPSNLASQKAFEKAGFRYDSMHPNGDALYYTYNSKNV